MLKVPDFSMSLSNVVTVQCNMLPLFIGIIFNCFSLLIAIGNLDAHLLCRRKESIKPCLLPVE